MAHGLVATVGLSLPLLTCGGSPSSASSTPLVNPQWARVSHTIAGVTVTGPMRVNSPTFSKTLYGTNIDLSKVGYEKSQFFLSGTAHSNVPLSPLTSDGKWKITTGVNASYTTRIAVYRPMDPRGSTARSSSNGSMSAARSMPVRSGH